MKIKDLIKELKKGDPEKEVSVETVDDQGDFYYENEIGITYDDNGDVGIYVSARN